MTNGSLELGIWLSIKIYYKHPNTFYFITEQATVRIYEILSERVRVGRNCTYAISYCQERNINSIQVQTLFIYVLIQQPQCNCKVSTSKRKNKFTHTKKKLGNLFNIENKIYLSVISLNTICKKNVYI
jgi:hypothetical protein